MIIVISPAKTLDFKPLFPDKPHTFPALLGESGLLMKSLQKQKPVDLQKLMNINPKLAELNYERHLKWNEAHSANNSKQAIYVFKGEVYRGVKIDSYTTIEIENLQNKLRILSGLYGILRPLDLMQEYRLEMGSALENSRGNNLYNFWGNKVTEQLNLLINETKSEYLINLASAEYFKVVNQKLLNAKVINIVFLEFKDGVYKPIVVYTKKARGLMVSFIVKNNLKNVDELKLFDWEGYYFNPTMTSKTEWVFTRG
jgi:cytoplasmic iron level regulating protein YaaA (DUF328/UPF0246 family)